MPPYLRKVTYAYLERKESALQLLEQNLLHVSQMMTALLYQCVTEQSNQVDITIILAVLDATYQISIFIIDKCMPKQ